MFFPAVVRRNPIESVPSTRRGPTARYYRPYVHRSATRHGVACVHPPPLPSTGNRTPTVTRRMGMFANLTVPAGWRKTTLASARLDRSVSVSVKNQSALLRFRVVSFRVPKRKGWGVKGVLGYPSVTTVLLVVTIIIV